MANELKTERKISEETTETQKPIAITINVTVTALALPEQDGGYSLSVPALPGCYSQSDNFEEAAHNIQEAAQLWLDGHHDYELEEGKLR